ncbi:hypothetical protein HPULCUR_004111 [Helicostylum pulchrum]|uniref:Uncharacterized protein n=1 Tax=Helicostylum pulchrum TaxID=562976 RepID=A0ABP9XV94_9FUNG
MGISHGLRVYIEFRNTYMDPTRYYCTGRFSWSKILSLRLATFCLYVLTRLFFNLKIQLAVLVDDTSLFILFGMTKDKTATNTMLVLDLRNISSLSFSETYPLSNLSVASSDNSSSVASPDNSSSGISSGISSGAIAGIAVGAVVLVS